MNDTSLHQIKALKGPVRKRGVKRSAAEIATDIGRPKKLLLRSSASSAGSFRDLSFNSTSKFSKSDSRVTENLQYTQYGQDANCELDFPHGINKFEALRQSQKYFYVDKTSIIAKLDDMPRHIIIHRPPHWGKTLFLTMLRCYYDVQEAEKFESLFGGLEIGNIQSLTKNSYHVLLLDFGVNVSSLKYASESEIQENFKRVLFSCIVKFATDHNFPIPKNLDGLFGLKTLASWVHGVGGKLLILIDDYDKLTNNLLLSGIVDNMVRRLRYPIGGLLEVVKEISSRYNCRSIIASTSPFVLSDVYGASIWVDVSQRPEFGNVFGFSESDLRMALNKKGLAADEADRLLQVMQNLFAGYRFTESLDQLCDPSRAVYFLDRYFSNATFQNLVHTVLNSSALVQDELCFAVEDIYGEERRAALACISNLNCKSDVFSRLLNPDNPVACNHILCTLALGDLMDETAAYDLQGQRMVSFLYYFGLATMTSPHCPYRLQVPNQLVHKAFLQRMKKDLALTTPYIVSELKQPTAGYLSWLLEFLLCEKLDIIGNNFSGHALQIELKTGLRAIQTGEAGLNVLSQGLVAEGRCQICMLVDKSDTIVIELKRIRPSTIDYSSLKPGNRCFNSMVLGELYAASGLTTDLKEEELRGLKFLSYNPLEYCNASTVEDLETIASTQCLDYMRNLKQLSPMSAFTGFTVVQVGWRFLVKPVRFPT